MMGKKKNTNKKTILLQEQISLLQAQFQQNEIGLGELLEGLSLLVGTSK